MAEDDLKTILFSLKTHLEENDGELGYWGEKIEMRSAECGMRNEGGDGPHSEFRIPHSKQEALGVLRDEHIGECRGCPLGETRIKLVFGVGNPGADVMFVGEGPGYDEDRKGEPFVGKAGQLLDKILASIGLDRSKVYIANVVKCHPMVDPKKADFRGNDRAPTPEEIEKCLPFLIKQVETIEPRIIVTLGSVATRTLLGKTEGISKLRGQIFHVDCIEGKPPIPILPTFHPAALLRDESLKRLVWEDMKKLRDVLGA